MKLRLRCWPSLSARTAEWADGLRVGDAVDVYDAVRHAWRVGTITSSTAVDVTVQFLYWKSTSEFRRLKRTHPELQPMHSQTPLGAYTGPPEYRQMVALSPLLPLLPPVDRHPAAHPPQRFPRDHAWTCDRCKLQVQKPEKWQPRREQAYACIRCDFHLCADCFLASGGVDSQPRPCEPPFTQQANAPRSYSGIEFVHLPPKYECAICMSAAYEPANLQCGQSLGTHAQELS